MISRKHDPVLTRLTSAHGSVTWDSEDVAHKVPDQRTGKGKRSSVVDQDKDERESPSRSAADVNGAPSCRTVALMFDDTLDRHTLGKAEGCFQRLSAPCADPCFDRVRLLFQVTFMTAVTARVPVPRQHHRPPMCLVNFPLPPHATQIHSEYRDLIESVCALRGGVSAEQK